MRAYAVVEKQKRKIFKRNTRILTAMELKCKCRKIIILIASVYRSPLLSVVLFYMVLVTSGHLWSRNKQFINFKLF